MAYRHIVVATDLSEDAEFLLGKGARLAAALNAQLSRSISTFIAPVITSIWAWAIITTPIAPFQSG
ncbi:universal stress protein [Serratia ureilytica]